MNTTDITVIAVCTAALLGTGMTAGLAVHAVHRAIGDAVNRGCKIKAGVMLEITPPPVPRAPAADFPATAPANGHAPASLPESLRQVV